MELDDQQLQELVERLQRPRVVCVCERYCVHWQVHVVKEIREFFAKLGSEHVRYEDAAKRAFDAVMVCLTSDVKYNRLQLAATVAANVRSLATKSPGLVTFEPEVIPQHDKTHEMDSTLYCLTCEQNGLCGMCLQPQVDSAHTPHAFIPDQPGMPLCCYGRDATKLCRQPKESPVHLTQPPRFKGAIYSPGGPTDKRLAEIRRDLSDGYEEVAREHHESGAFIRMISDLRFLLSMVPDPVSPGGESRE